MMLELNDIVTRIKKVFLAFFCEIEMNIKTTFRYRFALISDLVVFSVFMTFFLSANVGVSFGDKYEYDNYKVLTLLGFIAWTVTVAAISSSTNEVSMELTSGTFYRKLNSVCSIQLLLFADMISTLIVETVVYIALLVIANVIWHVVIPINIVSIVAIGICALGMYGIGLILSGLAILLKRVGSIVLLVQTGLLFITDTLPTSDIITRVTYVIPLTCCNRVIRLNTSEQNYTVELLYLFFVSLIWFILGNKIFDIFVKHSKIKGNLLHY